ncbi:MAG: ABC transporter ATP-binding protein [Rickettsiales bacterium]|nr:ABC transporter ATP-binding protein [Rickettsiales bacterium]
MSRAFRAEPGAARAGLLGALLLFPFIFTLGFRDPYWVYVATLAGIYVCLALGLNVVVGLAGLLDLGYVAFYAIGAYSSALISLSFPQYWWAVWLWVPCVVVLAALFGVVLGFPTLRLRGDYLAIVTLGFGEIVRIVLGNWDSVTNGPKGLAGIPSPRIGSYSLDQGLPLLDFLGPLLWDQRVTVWGKEVNYYLLTLGYALLIALVAARLDNSRLGRAWRAVREDELAARSMGIDVTRVKLMAFGIGASFAGIAGLLFAHIQGFIDPMSFVFMESAIILCMVVLGGSGSLVGVVVGAILLAVLPEKLRDFQEYRMLIFGLVLVLMMVLRPQGLFPAVQSQGSSARS